MRGGAGPGVGAAGTERAQYRLVHDAALRRFAATRGGSRAGCARPRRCRCRRPLPTQLPRVRALRPQVAPLARLFAARAVALATGNAPPGPGSRPRLPALRRLPVRAPPAAAGAATGPGRAQTLFPGRFPPAACGFSAQGCFSPAPTPLTWDLFECRILGFSSLRGTKPKWNFQRFTCHSHIFQF